jgi:hypothetical protein
MNKLVIIYICIVIFQLIVSVYTSNYFSKSSDIKKVVIDEKNQITRVKTFIEKILTEKLEMIKKSNNLSSWLEEVDKKTVYDFEGKGLYVFAWINTKLTDKMILVQFPDKKMIGMSFADFYDNNSEIILNSKYTVSPAVFANMFDISRLDEFDKMSYYLIDPIYKVSVKKTSIFRKFIFEKENIEGVIGMGYNTENMSYNNEYKYFTYIHKPELLITSLSTILIAFVISKLHTIKNTENKALGFLILSNIFILVFINIFEQIGTVEKENQKITQINSSILSLSFLSSVNLFVLNMLYYKTKDLFVETSVVFGVAILLLLVSIYKSTNQNSIYQLIGSRVTNTFIYDFTIFLNIIIMLNFIFYTFVENVKNKK